ncbi:MAG TPA: hypothetical protein VK142_09480, partial [Bacillota bacterium]|nr:hypothetical protein [Bacillota bacterium]
MLTEHYIKILKHLEYLKEDTMMRINGETTPGGNLENITYKTVYPLAEVKPFSLNDYIVFHFAYEGALPLYKEKDSKYLSMIRHYYYRSTLDAYNFTKYQCLFSEAVLYI